MAEMNPYVGPRAFEEADSKHFFGRSDETRELLSLVVARRAVLFYAQSGAGKTSLVQASLLPNLKRRKRLEVLPIGRVAGGAEPDAKNIYVYNTLLNLFPESSPGDLADRTLAEGLGSVLGDGSTGAGSPENGAARLDHIAAD